MTRPLPSPPPTSGNMRVLNLLPVAVTVLALLLLFTFLGHVGPALLAFIFAVIVATALNPAARFLQRWMPRGVAGFLTVLGVLLFIVLLGSLAIPPLVAQLTQLVSSAPENVHKFNGQLNHWVTRYPQLGSALSPDKLNQFGQQGGSAMLNVLKGLPKFLGTFAEGGFMMLVTLVMVIFVLSDPVPLVGGLLSAVPVRYRLPAARAISTILAQLGAWGRATVLLMLATGSVMALGLYLLGIPNALVFGALAAVGELVPTLGAIMATIPPLLYAIADDPHKAVYMLIFALAFHALESYILSPFLLGRAGKFHPVSVTVGVLFFGSVFGLVGAFLTVPFMIMIKAVYYEFYLRGQEVPDVIAEAMLSGKVEEQFAREGADSAPQENQQVQLKDFEQRLEKGEIVLEDALKATAPVVAEKPKLP